MRGRTPTSRVSGEIRAPLRWALLESTNYHEYVANLRAIDCPEGTIHDIIRSVVESAYAPRFAALDHPGKFTADVAARVRSKVHDQALLQKDIDRLLYEELRIQRPIRATALFTAEQEEKILEAHKAFPATAVDLTNPESVAANDSSRAARIQYLSTYFPPEQLVYYRLDREGEGARITGILRGMQPSKDEFLRVDAAVGGRDLTFRNGRFSPDVEIALQSALGPDRYGLLHELRKNHYP